MGFVNLRFADRPFVLDDVDGTDRVALLMQQGIYESPLPMLWMALVARTPGLFLDVGANNGLYSVLAGITKTDAEVIAFEPYPPALKVLESNIRANGLTDRVTIHSIALSDSEGTATLFLPDAAHGLLETSCSLEAGFKPGCTTLEVTKQQLDNLGLLGKVGAIKVDVESHELSFLQGARNTILRDRPLILAEVLPISSEMLSGLTRFLQRAGYMDFVLRQEVAILSETVAHDPLAWNHAFIPRDRLDIFMSACAAHDIKLAREW